MFWAPKSKTFKVIKLKGQTDSSIKMCAMCQALFTLQTDEGFFMVSIQWETLTWKDIESYWYRRLLTVLSWQSHRDRIEKYCLVKLWKKLNVLSELTSNWKSSLLIYWKAYNYDFLLFRKIEKLNCLKFASRCHSISKMLLNFLVRFLFFFYFEVFQLDMEWHRDYLKGFTLKWIHVNIVGRFWLPSEL